MYSSKDLRDLMESIGFIEEENEHEQHEAHADESAKDLIKSIITELKNISERVINQDVDDEETLKSDLHGILDSLREMGGEETHSEDEQVEHDEEKHDEDFGFGKK